MRDIFFRGVLFLFIFPMWILYFDLQDLKEQDSGLGCTMSLVIWLSFGFEVPNTISTQTPQKSKFVWQILARKNRFLDWFQYFPAYFGCLRPRRVNAADQSQFCPRSSLICDVAKAAWRNIIKDLFPLTIIFAKVCISGTRSKLLQQS